MEYSKFVEKLKDFNEHTSKANMILDELIDCVPQDDQHLQDLQDLHDDFFDTFRTLLSWMKDNYEYFEIKLLFIAGYHDDALLSRLKKLLLKLGQIDKLEKAGHKENWKKHYEKGLITKEEYELRTTNEKAVKENIQIMTRIIKKKLGQD